MTGILFAMAAALFWGTAHVLARIGLQQIKPLTGTFISLLSSLVLVGSLALIINFDAIASLSLTALLWFGLIGVINYAMGRQFRFLSFKYIGVSRASPIFSSAPLFAMLVAVTFTGEQVNLLIVSGTFCIVAGLILLVTSK